MSADCGNWGPPSPASKRRRLDPACQLQKETEAAQALADMTTWGSGSLETVNQQEAREISPAQKGSLEVAGLQGARETTPAANPDERSGPLKGLDAGEEQETASGGEEARGNVAGGTETDNVPRGRVETALGDAKVRLDITCVQTDEAGDGREGRRKRKDARERRRAAEVAAKAEEDECSIISVGEEDDEDEEEDEEGGRPQPSRKTEQYLEALEAVQLELEAVNQQASRTFAQLKAKFSHIRRPHLERRNRIIRNIPGFWVTAVSCHRHQLSLTVVRDFVLK